MFKSMDDFKRRRQPENTNDLQIVDLEEENPTTDDARSGSLRMTVKVTVANEREESMQTLEPQNINSEDQNSRSSSLRSNRRSRSYPSNFVYECQPGDFNLFSMDNGDRSPSVHSMTDPLLSISRGNSPAHVFPAIYTRTKISVTGGDTIMQMSSLSDATPNTGRPTTLMPSIHETLHFNDNLRRIDFVLAYNDDDDLFKKERRDIFQKNLEEEGLEIELEDKKSSQDGRTYFLKIHATWEALSRFAELMNLKMPIKEDDLPANRSSLYFVPTKILRKLDFVDYDHELIPDEQHYFTCAFNRERTKQFLIKDHETFFSNTQRSRIVWEILMRTNYDGESNEKMGILRLLSNDTYQAALPLHEGSYCSGAFKLNGVPNTRRILYKEWARIGRWYKRQPLHLIRRYFGEKIGIYFAWLGFYTTMLVAPALIGVACFFYGIITLHSSKYVQEICDETGVGNLTMCPLCMSCPTKKLYESCDFAKITYLFDNNGSVFFAIFMSFWATFFLEYWKRYQARIAWEWDLSNFEDEEEGLKLHDSREHAEENPRPEYEVAVQANRIDPITKKSCEPIWKRSLHFFGAVSCILFMLTVVAGAVFGVIVYRISIMTFLNRHPDQFFRDTAKLTASVTAAIINFIFILIIDKLYHRIAKFLTDLEHPRTQTDYEDSFTFKMFIFQFVNFYSSLIYIAFFKGRVTIQGVERAESGPLKTADQCDPAGCIFELCIQLFIIMVGKQVFNNINEIMAPLVMNWWRSKKNKNKTGDGSKLHTRWEQDYELATLDRMALFDEYIEMVLQYGFVTLFVSAFPLAPLFALINNVVEIRLDAYKFVTQVRRPIAARAQDIGAWLGILRGLSILSVISNAFVIAYTSDFIPRNAFLYYYSTDGTLAGYFYQSLSPYNLTGNGATNGTLCWFPDFKTTATDMASEKGNLEFWHVFAARLIFIVVYEHVVFSVVGIMAYLVPDIPSDVKNKLQREKLLAREALYEAEFEKVKREKIIRKNADSMQSINNQETEVNGDLTTS